MTHMGGLEQGKQPYVSDDPVPRPLPPGPGSLYSPLRPNAPPSWATAMELSLQKRG